MQNASCIFRQALLLYFETEVDCPQTVLLRYPQGVYVLYVVSLDWVPSASLLISSSRQAR